MITVQHDKTYTPLKAEFDGFMEAYFADTAISPEQRKIFETFFFAGSISVYGLLVRTPELTETVFEELNDFERQTDRVKV